jgi:hypothetical protein
MADGPPGILRVFPCHSDNVHDLFRRTRGRRARAGVSGQGLHAHGGERFGTACVGFHLRQLGGQGTPPSAPHRDRAALEVHLAPDVALGGSRREGQKALGASHQTLGASLTAGHRLQAGPLSCGPLHPGRDGRQQRNSGSHTSILLEEFGHFWLISYHAVVCMNTSAKHH